MRFTGIVFRKNGKKGQLPSEPISSPSVAPEGRPRLAGSPSKHGHPAGQTQPAVNQSLQPHPQKREAASVSRTHRIGPRRQPKSAPWGRSRAEAFGSRSGEEAGSGLSG